MNLDNRELLALREDVFDQYRNSMSEIKSLENEYNALHQKIENIHSQIMHKNQEQSTIKSIINIMIEEDCDPVTAKLKFSDRITQQEVEEKMVASTTYGYGFASDNKYISTSSPNFYDDH